MLLTIPPPERLRLSANCWILQNDDVVAVAEEKAFLKDYTIPFIQLDPLKTILVVHAHVR
jgi:hypothetical protein